MKKIAILALTLFACTSVTAKTNQQKLATLKKKYDKAVTAAARQKRDTKKAEAKLKSAKKRVAELQEKRRTIANRTKLALAKTKKVLATKNYVKQSKKLTKLNDKALAAEKAYYDFLKQITPAPQP